MCILLIYLIEVLLWVLDKNILIELNATAFVSLEVFNSLGERVAVLLNNQLSAGSTNVSFDASSLSTGVYLYRLNANGVTIGKKMMLIK